MTFDTKKAVEAWKKAKPLLLTDTGISDFLRKMPADGMSKSYLADLEKSGKKLDSFMADPKVKAEKKAVACLKQIQDDIKKHVDGVQANRKHVMGDMDRVLAESKNYAVEAISKPTREGLMKIWLRITQLERGGRLDPREHDDDPPLRALMGDWFTAGGLLNEAHTALVKLLELHEKKPLPDFKTLLPQKIKHFGDMRAHLLKVRQAVGNI